MKTFKYLTTRKAPWPSEVYAQRILASGYVRISVNGTLPENTRCKKNTSRQGY